MRADIYLSFLDHLEKISLDETKLDAFHDELERLEKGAGIGLLGGLGGALRGGAAAAKGIGKGLMTGRGPATVGAGLSRLGGGLAGGFRQGAQLAGRHALTNVALGAGAAGIGAGYGLSKLSQ